MATVEEQQRPGDSSPLSPTNNGSSSPESSKCESTTGLLENDSGYLTNDMEYEQDFEQSKDNKSDASKAETRFPSLINSQELLKATEKHEDSIDTCDQLLQSIPSIPRCLGPNDLNPPRELCENAETAMGKFTFEAKGFLAKRSGTLTVGMLQQLLSEQMASMESAQNTLRTVAAYLSMSAMMLQHVDAEPHSRRRRAEGNESLDDADIEAFQDLYRQIRELKDENHALKRIVAAPPLRSLAIKESSSSVSDAELRPLCQPKTTPEVEAVRSTVTCSDVASLPSLHRARSMAPVRYDILPKEENIAEIMDQSFVSGEHQDSDTFSEAQAKLLQQPVLRSQPCPISDWLSEAEIGSWNGVADLPDPCVCGGVIRPGMTAEVADILEENRLLDADFKQLSNEYIALETTYNKMVDRYETLEVEFEELLEEHRLLRKRYDSERDIHNKVTSMYVTRTSGVEWNKSGRGVESPCVSPRTVVPLSSRGKMTSSLTCSVDVGETDEGNGGGRLETFCGFVASQWRSWTTLYNFIWTNVLFSSQHAIPASDTGVDESVWTESQTAGAAQIKSNSKHGTVPWAALFNMITHIVLVTSILNWISCHLERDIWLQANGLTRNQLIVYTRGELVWLSNLGLLLKGQLKTLALWMGLNSQRMMDLVFMCSWMVVRTCRNGRGHVVCLLLLGFGIMWNEETMRQY